MTEVGALKTEFGFDPTSIANIGKWGIVRCLEIEENAVGAQLGDLYIMTSIYTDNHQDFAKLGRYIGMSTGAIIPTARFHYYRSKTNAMKIASDRKKQHPIQPLEFDTNNVLRFKPNMIVTKLLKEGPFTMNDFCVGFSDEDKIQFAQLIGYSLSGFSELSYVDDATYDAVHQMYTMGISESDARIYTLEDKLKIVQDNLKPIIISLFNIPEEDLTF